MEVGVKDKIMSFLKQTQPIIIADQHVWTICVEVKINRENNQTTK